MRQTRLAWIAGTVGAAVVAGAVVFLSLQPLGDADSWSSIGAFLTALVTVLVSTVAWVRRGGGSNAPTEAAPVRRARRQWWAVNLGNGVVINGDDTTNHVGHSTQRDAPSDRGRSKNYR